MTAPSLTPSELEQLVDAIGNALGVDMGSLHEARFAQAMEAAKTALEGIQGSQKAPPKKTPLKPRRFLAFRWLGRD